MFDGVPEQFHQFIASTASPSRLPLPPPPAFPFHGFHPFPNPNPSPPPPLHQHHFLHHPSELVHHKFVRGEEEEEEKDRSLIAMSMNFDIDARADRSIPGAGDHSPWSKEEVVALLRIGAGNANWFPEATWEHVSRKLAEIGFKRSAEKCKEKFEEQTRSFSNENNNIININVNYSKNSNCMLLVNELEGLYDHRQSGNHPTPPQQLLGEVPHNNVNIDDDDDENIEKTMEEDERGRQPGGTGENIIGQSNMEEVDSRAAETAAAADNEKRLPEEEEAEEDKVARKRKRREKKLEMFKRFCENVVERLMAQQEDMHKKLVEDMMTREKEMVEWEEARKKMEMERVEKELEIKARERSFSHDRQAAIIELLKRFTSPDPSPNSRTDMESEPRTTPVTGGPVDDDRSNPCPLPTTTISPNPNSSSTLQDPRTSNTEGSDTGKRWPREEVMALINLRCTIQGNGDDRDHRHPEATGAIKAPVWERIAQGMSELGYRRSAKKCKEKWENINKYFRKTRDSNLNKKRSPDSRTCPYFHQLSALYINQGKLAAAVLPKNGPSSPDYRPGLREVEKLIT